MKGDITPAARGVEMTPQFLQALPIGEMFDTANVKPAGRPRGEVMITTPRTMPVAGFTPPETRKPMWSIFAKLFKAEEKQEQTVVLPQTVSSVAIPASLATRDCELQASTAWGY